MKRANSRSGFTLLELLTVVAIIAILAAILFPVFKSVKDNAKKGACTTNLHDIASAMQQYKLDNRRYPMALLARYEPDPANPSVGKDMPTTMEEARGGLYPEYIRSIKGFRCTSSNVGEFNRPTAFMPSLSETGEVVNVCFFQGDSYDWAWMDEANSAMPSYAYMWAPTEEAVTSPLNLQPSEPPDTPVKIHRDFATRQLRWRNPDANTVVTWCMNHRGGGDMALVLFLDASVDSIPRNRMLPITGGVTGENVLWRIMPK